MATSRGTSNGPDWRDISLTMDALEEEWGMPVEMTIYHSGTRLIPELRVEARFLSWTHASGGLKPWVSASRSMRSGDATDFAAALLVLLYSLDGAAEAKKEKDSQEAA